MTNKLHKGFIDPPNKTKKINSTIQHPKMFENLEN